HETTRSDIRFPSDSRTSGLGLDEPGACACTAEKARLVKSSGPSLFLTIMVTCRVELMRVAPSLLHSIHSNVCILDEAIAIQPVIGKNADSNARADMDFFLSDTMRRSQGRKHLSRY